MSSVGCILKVLVSCFYNCLLILGLALFWIMFVGESHLLLWDALCSFCCIVEEILMRESFCSPKYRGCCLILKFVAKPSEKKKEENGELSFKPFCDLIQTFGNTLLVNKVYWIMFLFNGVDSCSISASG
jgi:hypothetical protein